MRAEIDQLMAKRDLQAIFVTGGEQENTPRRYISNGIDIHAGMAVKKRGADPVLIVGGMELEEAAKSGLQVFNYADLGYMDMLKTHEGDGSKACVDLYGKLIEKFEIPPGKIGLYGVGELHVWLERVRMLGEKYPQHQFVGETKVTLFDEAYLTKDAVELNAIMKVAAQTNETLQATWDFIAGHRASGNAVVKADGLPLTVGDVKRFVRRDLMDRGLEDTGMIFSHGHDCTYPHSRGTETMALEIGQPIIFDLFPRPLGGGYYHDCTRTWCIGHATNAMKELYAQVAESFEVAQKAYKRPGQACHEIQDAVQDYFEKKGHKTQRSHPGTTDGYVHGLGHGVGLNIHEGPQMNHLLKEDTFKIGNFITIEPGLYYPDRGVGGRIEDSFIIDERGALVSLTPFSKELVLTLRG